MQDNQPGQALSVSELCVSYGDTQVVHGATFSIAPGDIMMLVGPTGCGKTTLLQALAGLVPITGGSVSLGDWTATAATEVPPEQRGIGMVFQDFALFPHLTVEQNVAFRLDNMSLAHEWLDRLGMYAFRQARPGRLSGGQKQRVALARALAHEPALMLLDEPLSSLDAALKDDLRWEIREALKSAGVAAVWVTHDQAEALSVGDRVGVLRAGVLEQLAPPEDCYSAPANRFVARFLGPAAFVAGQYANGHVTTPFGTVAARPAQCAAGIEQVEALLRPGDLNLSLAQADGQGAVVGRQFQGDFWLYNVGLDDGETLMVRAGRGEPLALQARVDIRLSVSGSVAVFAPAPNQDAAQR